MSLLEENMDDLMLRLFSFFFFSSWKIQKARMTMEISI